MSGAQSSISLRTSVAFPAQSVLGPLRRPLNPPLAAVLNASMKRERSFIEASKQERGRLFFNGHSALKDPALRQGRCGPNGDCRGIKMQAISRGVGRRLVVPLDADRIAPSRPAARRVRSLGAHLDLMRLLEPNQLDVLIRVYEEVVRACGPFALNDERILRRRTLRNQVLRSRLGANKRSCD